MVTKASEPYISLVSFFMDSYGVSYLLTYYFFLFSLHFIFNEAVLQFYLT